MNKGIIWLIVLSILITILGGCSKGTNGEHGENKTEKLQRLTQVQIYSGTEHVLIKTIEDKETLNSFNENTSFTDEWSHVDEDYVDKQEEAENMIKKYEPQYIFVAYKTPAAINKSADLEKIFEMTIYKDTNMIGLNISPNNVKNISIPSEYLNFYFEATDEVIEYLKSLAE